jgi:hypothetical protein
MLEHLNVYQISITESLKTAREREYFRYYQIAFRELSEMIKTDAEAIIAQRQKFTTIDIGVLAIKYNLAFKVCCEFLEKLAILPTGTYQKIRERKNFNVRDIFAAARKRREELGN